MLQHILVGLDGSPLAESILDYVSVLAKAIRADMTLLHVISFPSSLQSGASHRGLGSLLQQEETQAFAYLQRVAARFVDAGIKVQSRVAIGEAAAEIIRTAQQEHLDLIALATHGRSGLQRWVHGSVAERVLHTTCTPLLLIHPSEEPAPPLPPLTSIMVPLDGSPLAETVLPFAEALALQCHVRLVLLRVVEVVSLTFVDPAGMVSVDYRALLDSFQNATDHYVDELAARVREKGMQVETATPMGFPAEKIVSHAHDHAGSLVVMATHGRTGLANVVLGSIARRVVQHVNTPTLIVRPGIAPGAVGSSA